MAEQGLKDKTVKGVGWSAIDAFLGHGVTFLVGIVLARLLSPSEYGLIGIVTIFVVILTGIVDSGFSNALIRKKDATNEDYNTMFITNMLISVALYFLLFFAAPAIAFFFERNELVSLVRVMGLILIVQALSITQVTLLTKKIDFKTKTKASVTAAIISGAIGIVMAFVGLGVWSLVCQQLSNKIVYTLCLWLLNRWCPTLSFSKTSFRYMWGFGWKLMVSGLLNNIWNQMYRVIVGKFYNPVTLGQYTRAGEYSSLLSSNFTTIVQRVSYPVLAQVQDEKARMIAAYRRVIKTTMFMTCISMLSMAAVSEPLIYCLIGPKWHMAATFLPLICLSQSLYPLHAINLNMLQVQGRSDIFLILEIIKKILGIIPLLVGVFVGIYWMLVASLLFGIACVVLNTFYTGKLLGYSTWMQLKDIAPFYGIGLLIAIAVYFFKYLPISNFIILPLQIIVGFGVFYLVCEKRQIEEYLELKDIAMQYLLTMKKVKK